MKSTSLLSIIVLLLLGLVIVTGKKISKQNDTIYEQKFRDKVLNFLQNDQVKLFKSPTESIILLLSDSLIESPKPSTKSKL